MDLNPCPFCGDRGRKVFNSGKFGAYGFIECDLCGCRTKGVKIIDPPSFETEEAFWNQRAWEPVIRNWNRRRDADKQTA